MNIKKYLFVFSTSFLLVSSLTACIAEKRINYLDVSASLKPTLTKKPALPIMTASGIELKIEERGGNYLLYSWINKISLTDYYMHYFEGGLRGVEVIEYAQIDGMNVLLLKGHVGDCDAVYSIVGVRRNIFDFFPVRYCSPRVKGSIVGDTYVLKVDVPGSKESFNWEFRNSALEMKAREI